jgi:hypothetical protein
MVEQNGSLKRTFIYLCSVLGLHVCELQFRRPSDVGDGNNIFLLLHGSTPFERELSLSLTAF